MKFYELTYLISPESSETKLKAFQEKIISLVQKEGGILVYVKEPVKKNLAYPIKKKNQAYLVTLDFQLNPGDLESLEKKIKAEKQILRYLLFIKKIPEIQAIKVPEIIKKPPRIPKKIVKPKVELKEIEKKLEEILGE